MQQGLAGIRVLDFSDQIAGPYCSKLLVDAGAEVVKVEPPGGDSLRRWSATDTDLHGSPPIGAGDVTIKALIKLGKERKYVTYPDFNQGSA